MAARITENEMVTVVRLEMRADSRQHTTLGKPVTNTPIYVHYLLTDT